MKLPMSARLPLVTCENNQLEVMQEQELRQFIADEDYVVVLFMTMNGVSCQPLLDRLTFALVKTGVISDLSKKKTELEKIKFCLGVEVTYSDVKINVRGEIQSLLDVLYEKSEDHSKSEALALKAKNQGSKAYLKKKDREALNCFSESICLAPTESSVLPLALANRSAVLYQMRRYKESHLLMWLLV
ncbi:hypothetical protein E2C01_000932 [Portunus trituberculatus]|uniref:Uncharacterized protein n=1 Tax=Portunus trituberculatus TaxID=210409 RepID=A0A5B7CFY3_PORTR|nr:hypothetical protein [Portunus trituberculatus]